MNPQRRIRRPQIEWNFLHWNIFRGTAVSKADAGMKNDPYLSWKQTREHNRRDALKPLARVFEVSCHDKEANA